MLDLRLKSINENSGVHMVEACMLDSYGNVSAKKCCFILLTLLEIICKPLQNTKNMRCSVVNLLVFLVGSVKPFVETFHK